MIMATCLIYVVGTTGASSFLWKWRTVSGDRCSDATFQYFHDCMANAIASGHEVDLPDTIATLKSTKLPHKRGPAA